MEVKRRIFQGVLNILSFNRHFYFFGFAIFAALIISYWFFNWPHFIFLLILVSFGYGLTMPLIVSAYVYDFSGYYRLDWLKSQLKEADQVKLALNINAGFDETSFIIKAKFPDIDLKVFDFYNAQQHTEPAIKRARKASMIYPGTQQIETNLIPLPDKSVDVIFLLSAIHEIRSHEEKIQFLKECHRVSKVDGKVIMVEHLRDFPNFLAFTIGFTHFFSRTTWKSAIRSAGFSNFTENKFTPFMSVFSFSQ